MTTIQIRIDEKTKKSAQKVFNKLGIDMSTAIKAYLKQVTMKNGIPFPLYTENGLTVEEEREILQASEDADRGVNVSEYMSVDEMLKELK
ncbi:MAG: type II toxin-antitoxin system RelB/DinJ family antitoxin [bacterium]|nr:type II toxin-antitoxin system RelB/DinJ family antitoxin [bacterium]